MSVSFSQVFYHKYQRYFISLLLLSSAEHKRFTYSSFKREVDNVAQSLLKLGFGKNDHIAVVLPNTSENVVLTYVCSKLGLVKVVIYFRLENYE